MYQKDMMIKFLEVVELNGLMTDFIRNIFNYKKIYSYNYIYRIINLEREIIIDIYDNVTINRFNRYIYCFDECNYVVKEVKKDYLYCTYISILNVYDGDNNLYKFGYIFNLNNNNPIGYATLFLDEVFVNILRKIIK